jgi:hypothetical protein
MYTGLIVFASVLVVGLVGGLFLLIKSNRAEGRRLAKMK